MKFLSFLKNTILFLMLNIFLSTPIYASETIKIGLLTALTGSHSSLGISGLRAVELVVDKYNANNGILGKKIEIIPLDDKCDPRLAVELAPQIIKSADVVIGSLCSGSTEAILPIFIKAEKLLVSPTATAPSLTLKNKAPYFIRTIPHDHIQSAIATEFIGKYLKAHKIALIDDNTTYGTGYIQALFENIAKKYPHVAVSYKASLTHGATDYAVVAEEIASSGASILIWGGYYRGLAELAKIFEKEEYNNITIVGAEGIKNNRYLDLAKTAAEGTYASGITNDEKNAINIEAHKAYAKKYNAKPQSYFENTYTAALAILNAIEKAQSTDTKKVANQILSSTIQSPLGTISFDKNGDILGLGMTIYRVEKNIFTPIYSK